MECVWNAYDVSPCLEPEGTHAVGLVRRIPFICFLALAFWSFRVPFGAGQVVGADPVPLIPDGAEVSAIGTAEWRWDLDAAERALALGFPSLSASFYRKVLEAGEGEDVDLVSIRIDYISALIASNQIAEAESVLARTESASGAKARLELRRAMIRLLSKMPGEARLIVNRIDSTALPAADLPWYYLTRALLRGAAGDTENAAAFYDRAIEAVSLPALRSQFELMRLRAELISGKASEEMAAELRLTVRTASGQVAGFEASRLLAVTLVRLGRVDEAVEVIDQQLRRPGGINTVRRNEFLLMLGVVAGDDSGRGRLALRQLLSGDASGSTQLIALTMLSAQPIEGKYRSEFLPFLEQLIARPARHPLLDRLLILHGMLMAMESRFPQAEADAQKVVEQFPGSPLIESAFRLLAFCSWKRSPPRYRTAASYLSQLRSVLSDPHAQSRTTVLIGDCYFFNEDYLNASEAYGAALKAGGLSRPGDVLFQQVISEIRADRLGVAEKVLDEGLAGEGIDPIRRWQAEWNLLDARRENEDYEDGFRRIRTVLSEIGTSNLPLEFELRMRWMEARLAVDAGRADEAVGLTDALIARLDQVSEGELTEISRTRIDILSHAMLLKGEALLMLGQSSEAQAVFGELRDRFPDSGPDMLSYLVEARLAARESNLVAAQSSLISLADRFPNSRYAPIARWEAALQAEQRGLESSYQEALRILQELLEKHPNDRLAFYARLKQADLSRKLNEFGSALVLYERILAEYPNHPERFRVEMSRGDCLFARGAQSGESLVAASVVYERLFLDPSLPIDAAAEAGFNWGMTLIQRDLREAAKEAFFQVTVRFLMDSDRMLRLGAQGRYWVARAVMELGQLYEAGGTLEEMNQAKRIYDLLIEAGLPGVETARARIERLSSSREPAQNGVP